MKNNKGYAMVTALIFITAMLLIGTALILMAESNAKQSAVVMQTDRNYYAAESAVQVAAQNYKTQLSTQLNSLSGDFSLPDISFSPSATNNEIETAVKANVLLLQKEVEKILYNTYNAMPKDYLFNDDNATLLTWPSDVSLAPITFSPADPVVNMDADNDLHVSLGTPRITLSAQSGLRIVTMDVDLTATGFEWSYTKGRAAGIETVEKWLDLNAGAAYNDKKETGLYEGNTLFTSDDFKNIWPCTTFTHLGETPCPCKTSDYEDCELDCPINNPDDERDCIQRHFENIKQAEYTLLTETMDLMFSKHPTYPSIYEASPPSTTTSQISYRKVDGNWVTVNASTVNATWFNNNQDVEYLYVPGSLTLSGTINTPNLTQVYVGGILSISSGATFTGSSNLTNFLVTGGASTTPKVGMTVNVNGTTTVNNAQFYVENNINVDLGNGSGINMYGNGIYISYNGMVNFAPSDSGNNFNIGQVDVAPQFYAKNGLKLRCQGESSNYYGIYGTSSTSTITVSGSSSTDLPIRGLLIGNLSESAKFHPSASQKLDKGALSNGDYMDFLSYVMGGGSTEEEVIIIPEVPGVFSATLKRDSSSLQVIAVDTLRETPTKTP